MLNALFCVIKKTKMGNNAYYGSFFFFFTVTHLFDFTLNYVARLQASVN